MTATGPDTTSTGLSPVDHTRHITIVSIECDPSDTACVGAERVERTCSPRGSDPESVVNERGPIRVRAARDSALSGGEHHVRARSNFPFLLVASCVPSVISFYGGLFRARSFVSGVLGVTWLPYWFTPARFLSSTRAGFGAVLS